MSKRKRQAKTLKILLAVALMLLAMELCWLIFALTREDKPAEETVPASQETTQQEQSLPMEPSAAEEIYAYPWEEPGAKQPADYTWAEFEALTAAQQMEFQNYLGLDAFEAWQLRTQEEPVVCPWEEPGAKQPADYTWAEFEALTAAQQMEFQEFLGLGEFETWMTRAQEQPELNPWEEPGAKQPADYTWAEFEALTAAQQMEFQEFLGQEAFLKWMNREQKENTANPWELPGAKQPADYTWAEFEALTAAQQMEFQDYLGLEAFLKWMNREQEETVEKPWELPGAKQPADYTWAEFEALSVAQQIAFQDYMGEAGFEAWMNKVNP